MSATVRSALRVVFLTVMILSASAVGQSFVQSTGQVETDQQTETPTPEPVADTETPTDRQSGTETPTGGSEQTATARSTLTATARPSSSGQTGIDVESRFQQAKAETLPGENWSAQRVREASGERGLTVVATQGFYVSGQTAEIAAITPNGTVVYFNDSYRVYFDVDPVEDERYTVEYVAARHFDGPVCDQFDSDQCTRNVVIRANLTTGDQETVYAELTPRVASARWHDVDRLNDTHLVVADIVQDSVYTVDTRDDEIVWEWNASDHYSRDQGGNWADWTHVNDVEVLPDGRIMTSPRNMDEVIFLERSGGEFVVNESWTLGEDENHSILYEQHNPDYIPRAYGGPSVIVADSENTRIIEFQRVDGEWVQSWSWRDVRLQWPRDADRLPGGNTLVVDSNGNRLVELNDDDEIVWSADVGMPYDVERIGTGDESEGGPAARLRSRAPIRPIVTESSDTENGTSGESSEDRSGVDLSVPADGSGAGESADSSLTTVDQFWFGLKGAIPSLVLNSLLYASPPWVLFTDLAFAGLFLVVGLSWGSSEFYWSRYSLRGVAGSLWRRVGNAVERVQ